ncbi:beta-glucosidase [Catenulispora sp. MAP12-49]|uniref:glycoside hydrolase family 3 C-terminal domain-containing protein n=1 Tax=Catenulispora sp. MAP12-49 TaxID=3156302 RepID=UPI003515793D
MSTVRSFLRAFAPLVLVGAALTVPSPTTVAHAATPSCPWIGSTAPVDTRAAQVLAQMSLDEKIAMVHGAGGSVYTGYIPGDSRLCIPALKMQDGPVGVRMDNTTQLPAAADLAASFDPSLATSYGAVIGAEDKTKGSEVDLGPTINIVRDPRWGRAFESYSEDPYLTGQIAAGDINGIQSQGVMAQVKHWAVYNQETNRNTPADNAVIDDRTVHEIYTAAFGAAVAQSQPSSVMCSYSSVNGVYACENAYLNTILKDDFGFSGFITSDWGATHSTVASANAGMDMQMPDDSYFGAALKQAVQFNQVPQSRLDDMVTRILREVFRFGLFDHPLPNTPDANASTPAHLATAQQASEDGTVLLKNDGGILPLNAGKLHSIAVIGDDTLTAGGGSGTVAGTGTITPYAGIKARAGSGIDVEYSPGGQLGGQLPAVDSQYLTPSSGTGHGLSGAYYNNMTLSGTPVATRTDAQVAFNWSGTSPVAGLGATSYSAKWTGTLTPPTTGTYTFGLTSDDGSRLIINGQQVIDNWRDQAANTETAQVPLTAGQPVQVEVDYYQNGGDASVNLGWLAPGQTPTSQAAALAARSDVAIVYASDPESEGGDLANIDLPGSQNQLISAVAAANPNTIVVLNTGSAVTMPWLNQVKGVFEAWYPGQQAGKAIAALLFGDADPSGKLPVTFPTSLAQVPASTPAQWPGTNGTVQYSEGLDVGYRWYDTKDLTPLFPFGYGQSYTTFAFSNLHLSAPTLTENGHLRATANVTNTGTRAGAEVAQLYLTDPASTGEPSSQLRGFQKVQLAPGQTKQVHFDLTAQDASYWNTPAQAWALGTGSYTVRVGDSSRSLPLSGTFAVTTTTGPRSTSVTAPKVTSAGDTLSVSTTFTNGATQPVRQAKTTLTAPAGWTAKATTANTFPVVAPGQTVTTSWSVTVPSTAHGGSATLSAATAYAGPGTHEPGTATVNVAYANLAATYDTVGVSDDSNPAAGNLDGSGYSFSAQALASAGVAPGASIAGFTWPDIPAGQPDAVSTNGQIVALSGSGSSLSFLGTGTFGTQSGTVTVTYTDGTTTSAPITVADWYSDAAVPGCTLAATAPYWNRPAGSGLPADHQVSLYATSVPLSTGKQLAYVTLPSNTQIHIFATALAG